MLCLSEEERAKGIVCTSSGNHAQAVAYSGRRMGVDVKVVMPTTCSPIKLFNVKAYGATAVLVDVKDREQEAEKIIKAENRVMLHPFADITVKAGQGTIGLELLEDEPDLDAIVVPMGGGGLISGISTAVKSLKPSTRIYGVENRVSARHTNCKKYGRAVDLEIVGDTIADGTRGNHVDQESYDIIAQLVDNILLADDQWIRPTMRAVIEKAHVVAEPSSCMGLSMALKKELPVQPTDKVAFVLSGGNCDLNLLAEVITGEYDD